MIYRAHYRAEMVHPLTVSGKDHLESPVEMLFLFRNSKLAWLDLTRTHPSSSFFVRRRWVVLIRSQRSHLLLSGELHYRAIVEEFSGSASSFVVSREKDEDDFSRKIVQLVYLVQLVNVSISKSNIIKNILFIYLTHADRGD